MAVALIGSTTGCAMMKSQAPPEPPVGMDQASAGTYKVIFGTANGKKPQIYVGDLVGNVTIQDALKASNAKKKFRAMTVDVARRVESGKVLKLPVHVDSKTGEVMAEQNYAVHPGDEILVRKSTNPGMLDSVFNSLQNSAY